MRPSAVATVSGRLERSDEPRPGAMTSADGASLRWRILRDDPAEGPWNMAVDCALARCLGPGEGVLRIYRWSRPTLSLGRNQAAQGRYDPAAARGLGAGIVRRPSGGREVLHDRELTFAVLVPLRAFGGLRESYRMVNEALVQALRSLGVEAGQAGGLGRPPTLDGGPCFGEAAEGEVTARGEKLIGSAQARLGTALLQHGSLRFASPTVALEALRAPPSADGSEPTTGRSSDVLPGVQDGRTEGGSRGPGITLAELLDVPIGFPRLAAAVEAALAGTVGGEWARSTLTPEEREVAEELQSRYESPQWTWRR